VARLIFPNAEDRLVYTIESASDFRPKVGAKVRIYTDAAGTLLANILTTAGVAIANAELTVDGNSLLPLFQGPDGGATNIDTLYAKGVGGTTVTTIYANVDSRLDIVSASIDGVITGSGFVTQTQRTADLALNTNNLAFKIDADDWANTHARSVYDLPSAEDVPVMTWAAGQTSAIATPVTYKPAIVGTGVAVTGWDGETTPTEPVFRFFPGLFRTLNGGSGDLALVGDTKPGGATQAAKWPLVFSFNTDAANSIVEFSFFGGSPAQVHVEVNGRFVHKRTQRSSVTGSAVLLTLTFPFAKVRTIRVWGDGSLGLIAVRIPTGQTLTKPAAPTRRVAVVGDSFVNGAGAGFEAAPNDGTNNRESFAPQLGRMLGAGDMLLAGIGGTGFVAGMDGATPNPYSTRSAFITSKTPQVLIVNGSINDGTATGTIQAAVEAFLANHTAVSEIYVLGTMLSGYNANNEAVKAGTLAAGRTFIDVGGIFTGTGNVISQAGNGNRDVLLRSDNSHPTFGGHEFIARTAFALIARARGIV